MAQGSTSNGRTFADSHDAQADSPPARFTETRWSRVLLAAQGSEGQGGKAREELCLTYWQPIYGFLRQKGHSLHDAQDLAQQFFLRILRSNLFSRADRTKGRFRSFLLGALHHFLADEARKASSQKRRGDSPAARVDFQNAEDEYLQVMDPNLTPEQVYDRCWAANVLDQAFQQLQNDFRDAQQLDRFEVLKSYLSEEAESGEYATKSQRLGMSPKAFGMAVSRLRQRYRQLIRATVADTLARSSDIDHELHDLFG